MKTIRRARGLPRISDAELVVMKAVWEKAPVTANQVVEALERQKHWKPKTIHTLLSRLVQKRALAFDTTKKAGSIISGRGWTPRNMLTPRAARSSAGFSTGRLRRSLLAFCSGKNFRGRKLRSCGASWTENKNEFQRRQSNP